jgi:hypothetical protein
MPTQEEWGAASGAAAGGPPAVAGAESDRAMDPRRAALALALRRGGQLLAVGLILGAAVDGAVADVAQRAGLGWSTGIA